MIIPILYEDEYLPAVNKPAGVHVHPSSLSPGEPSVQSMLEDTLEQRLFPAHRLDRPVGGVLLFAKNNSTASQLALGMRNRELFDKRYLCIVRGWMDDSGIIARPLRQAPGKPERDAATRFSTLARAEAAWSDGNFPTSRYSLVECIPESGRFHQIRRHLAVHNHPILGDVAHGDNPKNRIWRAQTGLEGLMLRAIRLVFLHPENGKRIELEAAPDERFFRAARLFGWNSQLVESSISHTEMNAGVEQ